MTQDRTKADALAGPDPIEVRILLNRQTGAIIVTGPTKHPNVMLDLLASAVSQVGRTVEPKEKEIDAAPKKRSTIDLMRPRIILPGNGGKP